jgi:hypothetical protein
VKGRVLTDAERHNAAIVYPARAMTGLRHVVVCGQARAICGMNAENTFMEAKLFNPKTIGCESCKAVWKRAS